FGVRGQGRRPGELQALTRDGQDEEGGQPGQHAGDVDAAEPQQCRTERRYGTGGLGEQGRARLPSPEAHVQRGQYGGPGDEQQPRDGQVHGAEQRQPPGAERGGGQVGPAAAQGDGAFQRDQRAGETQDQQHSVHLGQTVTGDRGGESEQQEGGIEPGEQTGPGGDEQRRPPGTGPPGLGTEGGHGVTSGRPAPCDGRADGATVPGRGP